ncbi:hypothetical protein OQA88_7248 [Cercophora sp. LCS_1]
MDSSSDRFRRLRPTIKELMEIGGTPGLMVAVATPDTLYTDNFGYRDVENELSVDDDTIFPGGSLTKAITAVAFSILVDEGKAEWDTPVKDLLPALNSRDETLQNFLTVTDLLCHRHGMAGSDGYAVSAENNCLIRPDDVMRHLNDQERLRPFRQGFSYNNNGYELVGKVIEQLSGIPYVEFVKERVFGPLGMNRTFLTTPPPTVDNVAECYNVLDDLTPALITAPQMGNDWWGGPSGGIRSSVADLLKLYKFFLKAFNNNEASEGTLSLRQGEYLMSPRVPLESVSRREASYAMGWARVQLPGSMGHIGINPRYMLDGMPVTGKGVPSELVMFHQGSLAGALAFVGLLPNSESVVLVLSNALALNDVPDWVGQLLLEELLEVPAKLRVNFVEAAKTSAARNLTWFSRVTKLLAEQRTNGTSKHRDLEAYVGTYWDRARIFKITVTLEDGKLYRALQGLDTEKFELHHYEGDTFTWLPSRNELSRRGLFVGPGPTYWKVEFKADDDGNGRIRRLIWMRDGAEANGHFDKV